MEDEEIGILKIIDYINAMNPDWRDLYDDLEE
jgi:hypothetical protein